MNRTISDILLIAENYGQLAYLSANYSYDLYKQYTKASNFTPTEVALYVEAYLKLLYQRLILREAQGVYYIVTAIAGMFGYIMAILVLKSPSFKTPSFVYHKFLCWYLLPAMLITFGYGICFILAPLYPNGIHGCLLAWFPRVTMLFTNVADLLTLCIAIDRSFAVWLPKKYYLVSDRKISAIICSSLFIFNAIEFPQFFGEDLVKTPGKPCTRPSTDFGKTATFALLTTIESIYGLFRGYSILAMSLIVVAGVARMSYRKRKKIGTELVSSHDREIEKLNKQLYRLSFACSVPIFVSVCIYFIYRQLGTGFITGLEGVQLVSLAEAQRHLDWRSTYLIWQLLNNMADLFGHFPYFYFYLWFSSSFRKATVAFIYGKSATITVSVSHMNTIMIEHHKNRKSTAL